jgi:hypothetical protein
LAERVKVTIRPPAAHPDVLDVRDAMRQVLEVFQLLAGDDDNDPIIWNLVFASTNTPFTAEGEAVARIPDVDITVIARTRKTAFSRNMKALASGLLPERTLPKPKADVAKRIFKRNQNGIGSTEVSFDTEDDPVTLTPRTAAIAIQTLEKQTPPTLDLLPANREREEIGSVEGQLIDVGTDYNQPAVKIIERKSGREIWCRVNPQVMADIAAKANFMDVWGHTRITVRGVIRYDPEGNLTRVLANSIDQVKPRQMTIGEIRTKLLPAHSGRGNTWKN